MLAREKVHVMIVEICGISFNPHNNSVGWYHSFVNHYIMVFRVALDGYSDLWF